MTVELEPTRPDGQPLDAQSANSDASRSRSKTPPPHIIDDGVGEAEASDHIDVNGEDDDALGLDDEPSV